MDNEQAIKRNHDYLSEFIKDTELDTGTITVGVKAIIAQFLRNFKRKLNMIADANGNYVTAEQIISAQIEILRECVVDLQTVLTKDKDVIQ